MKKIFLHKNNSIFFAFIIVFLFSMYNTKAMDDPNKEEKAFLLPKKKSPPSIPDPQIVLTDAMGSTIKIDLEDLLDFKGLDNNSTPEELYSIGKKYYAGNDGVLQDYGIARGCFLKAASKNNADAQCYMGGLYYKGEGVTRSYNAAEEWFLKGAENNDAQSQYNLGELYMSGIGSHHGVYENQKKATEYYNLAANQGLSKAQFRLGQQYQFRDDNLNCGCSFCCSSNVLEARRWYKEAEKQGFDFSYDDPYHANERARKLLDTPCVIEGCCVCSIQ